MPSEVARTGTVRKQKPVHGEEAGTEEKKSYEESESESEGEEGRQAKARRTGLERAIRPLKCSQFLAGVSMNPFWNLCTFSICCLLEPLVHLSFVHLSLIA